MTDKELLHAFRYLAGPPISIDDLKTVAEAASLSPTQLNAKPEVVARVVEVVLMGLDRRRFPWIKEGREPSEAERQAAVLASTAMMAAQRVGTKRRGEGKKTQEARVAAELLSHGLTQVPPRTVLTFVDAPKPGEFCGESLLGNRKADFLVRLWDNRLMPIECKVSNSATNSVKRLNNDAAAKAEAWRKDFGETQVVPAAVLGGVYKLHNLVDAQKRGLALFWSHDLKPLIDFIDATQAGGGRR
ncbi:MAG TPA: XamI family restriction endonuclease [Pirellulales bacterium]